MSCDITSKIEIEIKNLEEQAKSLHFDEIFFARMLAKIALLCEKKIPVPSAGKFSKKKKKSPVESPVET